MLPVELFTSVLSCKTCSPKCVLRDEQANVPQPGWLGRQYDRGALFIGQNPGARRDGSVQYSADMRYIDALREVKDQASLTTLLDVMHRSMQAFVMYRHYIPTELFDEVAIINVVRCRTTGNVAPITDVVRNCRQHLERWLDVLRPRAVVFNGVWAEREVAAVTRQRGLPNETINRQRSLSRDYCNRSG